MKTILTVLIFTLATLISFAQTGSITSKGTVVNDSISLLISELKKQGLEHFTFKDIPIDGSLSSFVTQLKKHRFAVKEITDEDAILTGKFTGEDVHVLVQTALKTVYGVTVKYNKQKSWKAIKSQYENMKFMLTAKYGEPMETIEKFDDSYYEKSGLELNALVEDKCTYMTHFGTKAGNGVIRLSIATDASLVINYADALNYLLVSSEVYKDL